MKKLKVFVWLSATLPATAVVYANLIGPPPGYTGAPGEATCSASGCHDAPSGGVGGLRVNRFTSQNRDTVGYDVQVSDRSAGTTVSHWGFQLTALDSLDQPFGEILVSDSLRTRLITGPGGRIYLSHSAAGVPGYPYFTGWNFLWIRPSGAAITDSAYFYVSALLADGDGTPLNDAVVTAGPVFCPLLASPGDVNINGGVTSADLIWMISYMFKGGNEPIPCVAAGDFNCDVRVTAADIIVLVNFVFKSGPPPCDDCPQIINGTWACR